MHKKRRASRGLPRIHHVSVPPSSGRFGLVPIPATLLVGVSVSQNACPGFSLVVLFSTSMLTIWEGCAPACEGSRYSWLSFCAMARAMAAPPRRLGSGREGSKVADRYPGSQGFRVHGHSNPRNPVPDSASQALLTRMRFSLDLLTRRNAHPLMR